MLNLDFTYTKYKDLCEAIDESKYTPLMFSQYFSADTLPNKFVILRHDVDRKPEQALKMAELENTFGITSTYYFRMKNGVFIPEIIRAIENMGHEIGYHYEVLDKAKGDFNKAIKIFEGELNEFRKICNVGTICPHGNPLSNWVNHDLWKKYDFECFGILGDPYLSIDYSNSFYFTDTGRSWNSKFRVKDVVKESANKTIEKIKTTDDIIIMIKKENSHKIFILTHPNRWNDSFGAWLKELIWQNVKNIGKAGILKYKNAFD
jgi:hypothetical protein